MSLTRRMINNDMTFGQSLSNFATKSEACAQNVVTRLRTYLGEWFYDTSFGVPYFQSILVKPVNIPLSESTLKAIILATDDVNELLDFSFNFNTQARTVSVYVKITTVYGDTEKIQVDI